MEKRIQQLAALMQRWGFLEDPAPATALSWIETFLETYGARLRSPDIGASEQWNLEAAYPLIAALRAEACVVPALELERLRSRTVLFFLDSVAQYVDHQPELRDLPLVSDLTEIAKEFGISPEDAMYAVRMAISGERDGPPLELLFPLLGHDRILMRVGAVNSHLLHGRGLEPIAYGPDGKPFEPLQGVNPERH
jgi:hypothetical protein